MIVVFPRCDHREEMLVREYQLFCIIIFDIAAARVCCRIFMMHPMQRFGGDSGMAAMTR